VGGLAVSREELVLLYEMLSYAVKRTFSEGEKTRLLDLVGRVEERLLSDAGRQEWSFGLTHPEEDVLLGAAETFCRAHELPFAAEVSREKARRVRALTKRFRRSPGILSRISRLFGKQ